MPDLRFDPLPEEIIGIEALMGLSLAAGVASITLSLA
jgi:hypothetical protein